MQLTNISRDVKEDLLRDRIYIPKEIRVHVKNDLHEIPHSDKLQREFSEDLKKLIDILCELNPPPDLKKANQRYDVFCSEFKKSSNKHSVC